LTSVASIAGAFQRTVTGVDAPAARSPSEIV
jgi:hypothetical protein